MLRCLFFLTQRRYLGNPAAPVTVAVRLEEPHGGFCADLTVCPPCRCNAEDELAAKIEPIERQSAGTAAGSDDELGQQLRAVVEERVGLQPNPPEDEPMEKDGLRPTFSSYLNHEASDRKAIYDRLVVIEDEVKKRGSRRSRASLFHLVFYYHETIINCLALRSLVVEVRAEGRTKAILLHWLILRRVRLKAYPFFDNSA